MLFSVSFNQQIASLQVLLTIPLKGWKIEWFHIGKTHYIYALDRQYHKKTIYIQPLMLPTEPSQKTKNWSNLHLRLKNIANLFKTHKERNPGKESTNQRIWIKLQDSAVALQCLSAWAVRKHSCWKEEMISQQATAIKIWSEFWWVKWGRTVF